MGIFDQIPPLPEHRVIHRYTKQARDRDALIHSVDYVTEREARAIRGAFDLGGHKYDPANMEVVFRDKRGEFRLSQSTVARFMDDWRKCGAWRLHGWGVRNARR